MKKKYLLFIKKRIPIFLFILFYLIFAFLTYKDYGISFDENNVYLRGRFLYTKIKGNDPILQEDFVINKGKNNFELRLYNNLYPAILYIFNSKYSFEIYHLLNLIFAIPIFIALYELLLYKYKRPHKAIIGPIFLFFTPYFLGNIPINPKDVPFATAYFISLFLIIALQKANEKLKLLLLGLSFGLTSSLRAIGYSIFLVYSLYVLFDIKKAKNKLYFVFNFLLELLIIGSISFLIQLITMPYIAADPFNHFRELLNISKDFPWKGIVLFKGKFYLSQELPWDYLPIWIAITTPLVFILLFLLYLPKSFKNRRDYPFLLGIVINLLLYYLIKPIIYDGYRHFLFLAPIIIYFSASSFIEFSKGKNRLIIYLITFVNIFSIGSSYLILHPYEYIYFNALAGGLKGAYKNFEVEYWNTSSTEAVKWLLGWMKKEKIKTLKVKVFGISTPVEVYGNNQLILTDLKNADIAISWERFNDHKKVKGKILYTVKREGVPLTHIIDLRQ